MKRQIERNGALLRVLHQIALAVLEARALPGAHRACAQGLRLVGHHQPEIDADHAAEAAAGLAGAERRIEGEGRRGCFRIMDVAIRAMQVGGIAPSKIRDRPRFQERLRRRKRGLSLIFGVDIHPALADAKCSFRWSFSSVIVPTVQREVRTGLVWSMAIAGGMPSTASTCGRSMRSRNCLA